MKKLETKYSKILKEFEACPSTEDVLKEIEKTEISDLSKDSEFIESFVVGVMEEAVLTAIEERKISIEDLAKQNDYFKNYLSKNDYKDMALKDLAEIMVLIGCQHIKISIN